MPAIRISNTGLTGVATAISKNKRVSIRLSSGSFSEFEFAGFICQAGARMLADSKPVKVSAFGVSCEDSMSATQWRYLRGDEYVLGVAARRIALDGAGCDWCVYVVVDKEGWPIIINPKDYASLKASAA